MFFSILIAKTAAFFLRLIGRGSSLPGMIALRLCPDLLRRMKLPALIVAVTGSNGKTSTTELICRLAETTGKPVICNYEGSNQIEGAATLFLRHSTLFGKVKAAIAVVESDERFVQHTFRQFTPQFIVITNLYRDQLTRNGHNEFVYDELKKGLPALSTLILNADDPLSASCGDGREQTVYYGIEPTVFLEPPDTAHAYDDGGYCPLCHAPMEYSYRLHNHLGYYGCTGCDYIRPKTLHRVAALSDGCFVMDGLYDIRPQMMNTMFANNIAAAFTAGAEAFGLPGETIAGCLSGYRMKNDRIRTFALGGHRGIFMLTKHENSQSYNGVLATVAGSRSRRRTVVIIFDQLSRKYVANDIGWLYDIDFELLRDPRNERVFLSGKFASDLAVRMDFAGIDPSVVRVEPDIRKMAERLQSEAAGEIFVLTCFTDIGKFTRWIKEDAV